MSFKVLCGLFSQVFVVSSNIILEASRGGNRRSKGHALDITVQDFVLCSTTIFLLLIVTKSYRMRTSFRVLWKVITVGLCKSHIIGGQNECVSSDDKMVEGTNAHNKTALSACSFF